MIYITAGGKRYNCMAPEEHRINITPVISQWVIDFTICDRITPAEVDELLNGNDLTFVYVDTKTSEETERRLPGYTRVNSVAIKYNQDLSCTASVQLGKELTGNVIDI